MKNNIRRMALPEWGLGQKKVLENQIQLNIFSEIH
jgi:hypothetical protein